MEKDRNFKIIVIIALLVAIAGLSVAYAGFTSTLNITGTASVSSGWNIIWKNLSSGSATGYASVTGKTLAIDSSKQSISGVIGTLKAPGDTITYTFDVSNEGSINATLTGITLGSLSCAPSSTDGSTSSEATSLCSNLSVSFKYDGTTVPTSGLTGLTTALDNGTSKSVEMTIKYAEGTGTSLSGSVDVTLSTTSFTYSQKTE